MRKYDEKRNSSDSFENLKQKVIKQLNEFYIQEGQQTNLFEVLSNGGLDIANPDSLNDKQIFKKLWEVINALALLNVFLHHTNHLSDRELYEKLYNDSLREEGFITPKNQESVCYYLDLTGSGSEDDIFNFLKYYASDEERKRWIKDFPEDDFIMPEHTLYDRDQYLPKLDKSEEGCC
jgi:hypothetical protein